MKEGGFLRSMLGGMVVPLCWSRFGVSACLVVLQAVSLGEVFGGVSKLGDTKNKIPHHPQSFTPIQTTSTEAFPPLFPDFIGGKTILVVNPKPSIHPGEFKLARPKTRKWKSLRPRCSLPEAETRSIAGQWGQMGVAQKGNHKDPSGSTLWRMLPTDVRTFTFCQLMGFSLNH